jgi:hypothetical protein
MGAKPKVCEHEARAKDEQVEEALCAGANIFGKHVIDPNVKRGEEEGVANAVENLDGNDQVHVRRRVEKSENEESDQMAGNSKEHGQFPAQAL